MVSRVKMFQNDFVSNDLYADSTKKNGERVRIIICITKVRKGWSVTQVISISQKITTIEYPDIR